MYTYIYEPYTDRTNAQLFILLSDRVAAVQCSAACTFNPLDTDKSTTVSSELRVHSEHLLSFVTPIVIDVMIFNKYICTFHFHRITNLGDEEKAFEIVTSYEKLFNDIRENGWDWDGPTIRDGS